ncbi:MAG: VOC family protein [Pseudomonadales bacterium]|nr:VOC family protein [Pseudomonadales bacterium]MCS5570271.1 VOC family protein [Pseudomonadales bacterium]
MLESFTVLLNVEDVSAAIAFYGELFGFEVIQKFEENNSIRWASLSKDQTQLMLNEHGERSNDRRRLSDSHLDVVLYIGVTDLDEIWRRVDQKGYSPSQIEIEDYGLRQFGFRDLDGYEIAVTGPLEQ